MPIDSSIALGVKPIEIESPVNQLARVMQIQGLQGQNRLHELQMIQAQQGMEDTNKLNQLYQNAIGADGKIDRTAVIRGAAQQGLGKHIPALQKGFSDADKSQADLSKAQIEATTKKLDLAGQAFGYVRNNPTVENAYAVLDYLGGNGVYSPEQVAEYKAKVAASPGSVGQMADVAFRSVLSAKDQLAKYETRNTGGTTDTIGIDPVTGKVAMVSSVKNTQSPDSKASVAATMRGQDMTDARAREANGIQRELKEIQLEKAKDEQTQRKQGQQADIAGLEDSISVLDKAINHPGRETATGKSSLADPRNYIPGTEAKDFQAVLDQIKGKAFMQAYQNLRGGGQITEIEGKKATDAIARLNTAQSDEEFLTSLNDLKKIMQAGYERKTGKRYAPTGASGDFGAKPTPAKSGVTVSNW